jgi:thioredoxin-like negative regulator of GroEL
MNDAVLLEFWAPWCKPCAKLEPVLDALADRVRIERVNADDEPDRAAQYDVLSLPTCVLLVDGEPRGSVVGVRKLDYFETWLAEVLPAAELGHDA